MYHSQYWSTIQERGFRTKRTGTGGIGGHPGSSKGADKTKWNMFADMFNPVKKKEDVAEGWNHYDTELKKLPETHQKTYTDGFVKGLLASKTTPHPTPKKSNTLTRFYIFLVACILIGYLMGGWFLSAAYTFTTFLS
ncbi:unnamed protein product [Cylicostephanus goldi]|uniref:Uncharacterized protein n=1 Tax=Cylicostephanus goldi TaxID=71465 RepID=A0A3P6TE05_CYLGO|nr:unnamed protein product [Cylicostephanus goldi]